MWNKVFSIAATVVGLTLAQVSFLPTWSEPVRFINLVVCVCIFFGVYVNRTHSLAIAVASGLVLELYAPYPFGTVALSLFTVVLFVYQFTTNVFTTRTLHSLLLTGMLATLVYHVAIVVIGEVLGRFESLSELADVLNWQTLEVILWQLVLHPLVLIAIYLGYRRFSGNRGGFFQIDTSI